jgi:hypothetical protein
MVADAAQPYATKTEGLRPSPRTHAGKRAARSADLCFSFRPHVNDAAMQNVLYAMVTARRDTAM